MEESNIYAKIFPQETLRRYLSAQFRPDGRGLTTTRKTVVKRRVLSTTPSSALCTIGNTKVLCGVRLEVAAPNLVPQAGVVNEPTGQIQIAVEIPALCASAKRSAGSSAVVGGRNSSRNVDAQSLARFLTTCVVDSEMLDLRQLVIEEGVSVWLLRVDVVCLDNDGNLRDAALLAVVNALSTVRLPQTHVTDEKRVYIVEESDGGVAKPLTLRDSIYPLTFAIVEDHLLIDPSGDEEEYASTVFTIVSRSDGTIVGIDKAGGQALSPDRLKACMIQTVKRARMWSKLETERSGQGSEPSQSSRGREASGKSKLDRAQSDLQGSELGSSRTNLPLSASKQDEYILETCEI